MAPTREPVLLLSVAVAWGATAAVIPRELLIRLTSPWRRGARMN